MQRTRVGGVEVIALVDTIQAYPATAVWPEAGDTLAPYSALLDSEGRVVMNFGCFLVIDGATRLLVDTGWGPEFQGQLLQEMDAAGVERESITHVLFTHLHGDHTGWNIDRATGEPVFGRARYLVPRADWNYYESQQPEVESFVRDVVPLQAKGRMDLIAGEYTIAPGLVALPTPGHTPGHTSVAITSAGEQGFILGDVVFSEVDAQETGMKSSFDWDGAMAIETRRQTVERLVESRALVGASHITAPGLGRFVREDGRTRWQAI